MEFLLVLPIPGSSIRGHEEVMHLEERVSAALGTTGKIDGYQSGPGETEFLILTQNPLEAYDVLRGLSDFDARPQLRAVYRQIDKQDYEVLYPEGSFRFHIA
ncbi:MAG TPA: hypothetical protein VGR87_15985 [Candidatus Limnocylindria bacterium]|nr:hypothetical protein [Candidatus Limnocylindria bacterium]